MIDSGAFSREEPDLFRPIVRSLLEGGDPYLLTADYASYLACQQRVAETYRDSRTWTAMSIRNVSAMGRFSADRTVREYAGEIWNLAPVRSPGNGDATDVRVTHAARIPPAPPSPPAPAAFP
jgi:starch phosphorylase